jgi:rhamnosyl/mannosyltransferase
MVSPAMVSHLRMIASEYDIIHVHHPDPMAALALRLSGYQGKVVLHWHSDIVKQKKLLSLYLPLQKWLIRRADLIVGTTPVYLA